MLIKVLYDYKYKTRDGEDVSIIKDENLILLDKTNSDWWHAQRSTENKAFYVPASYVEEILTSNEQNSTSSVQDNAAQNNKTENAELSSSKEERKNHDSFRNVIKKLSSNKLSKKNSMNCHDEKAAKPKTESISETSTFAKCFGRDMKNVSSRPQNRFQEELENALVNRGQRNIVYSSKSEDSSEPKGSNTKQQVAPVIKPSEKEVTQQKLGILTQKLLDNKTKAIGNITKEFESRVQKLPPKSPTIVSENAGQNDVLKKPTTDLQKNKKLKLKLPEQVNDQKQADSNPATVSPKSPISEMNDEAILKDNRKMWAIERLMSELMKSAEEKSKQESNKVDNELVEKMQETSKEKKNVFDFSISPSVVAPRTVTKKSPKVLDEYNEANILNDNEAKKGNYERPSYCSISLKSKKKNPTNLGVMKKLKSLDSGLQLTPSLEKLASEIQFIPANKAADKVQKQCSKSDSALHEFSIPKFVPKTFGSLDKNYEHSKNKVDIKRMHLFNRKFSFISKTEREQIKQQYKRKTRSLDDLNFAEEDTPDLNSNKKGQQTSKPVPLFKSTDSLKKKLFKPVPTKRKIFDVFGSTENVDGKATLSSSCQDIEQKWSVDLERSTAVGFKALLRTSDSGSEEFLQNKTFPVANEKSKYLSNDNLNQESDSFNLSDASRNVSNEMILSSIDSSESNPNFEAAANPDNFGVQLPEGWKQDIDLKTRQVCYINDHGDKWFSSNDSEGKIYFFEENSNKSSWALPSIKDVTCSTKSTSRHNSLDKLQENDVKAHEKLDRDMNDMKYNNWPQLFHGNMCILKEGFLNRTKITEHGKKLKKCWNTSYAVLTELFLLFFRDEKMFSAMKMGNLSTAKPDISVDLNGASIESEEKFSSRKNVFLINTIFGLQVLIQSDNSVQSTEWYQEIQDAIKALPSGQDLGK